MIVPVDGGLRSGQRPHDCRVHRGLTSDGQRVTRKQAVEAKTPVSYGYSKCQRFTSLQRPRRWKSAGFRSWSRWIELEPVTGGVVGQNAPKAGFCQLIET